MGPQLLYLIFHLVLIGARIRASRKPLFFDILLCFALPRIKAKLVQVQEKERRKNNSCMAYEPK